MKFILKVIAYAMIFGVAMIMWAPASKADGFIGMNYGLLDGCKATSLVGGERFNEFFAVEGSAIIDSTSCRRDGKKIEIDSMIAVHLNMSIPTLNDDWYIEIRYGHTQLSRIGASSFGGSTFGFGLKYYFREAYSCRGIYSEVGDIGFFRMGCTLNF